MVAAFPAEFHLAGIVVGPAGKDPRFQQHAAVIAHVVGPLGRWRGIGIAEVNVISPHSFLQGEDHRIVIARPGHQEMRRDNAAIVGGHAQVTAIGQGVAGGIELSGGQLLAVGLLGIPVDVDGTTVFPGGIEPGAGAP